MPEKSSSEKTLLKVPVGQISAFAQAIARHDLWNSLATHLKDQGSDHIVMDEAAIAHISAFVLEHQRLNAAPTETALICASHTPAAGGGPVYYPSGGGNAGAPDGGAPDGGAR